VSEGELESSQNGRCRLCDSEAELLESHVIPAFVFRFLKQGGPIRNSRTPNRRVQDGDKEYWLCSSCEGLFNKDETAFATKLFHPHSNKPDLRSSYESWLLRDRKCECSVFIQQHKSISAACCRKRRGRKRRIGIRLHQILSIWTLWNYR
jgi:hypothetical protein